MNVLPPPVAKAANSLLNSPPVANMAAPLNSSIQKFGDNVQKFNDKVQDGFNMMGDSIKNTAKNIGQNVFNFKPNSGPKPFENVGAPSFLSEMNKNMNKAANSVNSAANNAIKNIVSENSKGNWALPLGIFISLVVVFTVLFIFFAKEIRVGYENVINAIRGSLGMETKPPVAPPSSADVPTVEPPSSVPPGADEKSKTILEKVLPIGGPPEVFNVSKNEFSYYDAEPLCRALGAELATYDQVKEAYNKGADWCNYGWVKGQMAVYPTQKSTWDDLQKGPDEDRTACGKPGMNGGFFDNPEMRFGVNCYGAKPAQSGHDEAELMKEGRIPRTVATLKMDQKTNIYKEEADTMGVLPFNGQKWSSD
jgi:hypothetical protein